MEIQALNRLKEAYNSVKETVTGTVSSVRDYCKSDRKKRNRALIVFFALLFVLDYVMVSYHIEKNVFDIFPSFPLLERKIAITVYLPALDGETMLKEVRKVPKFDDDVQLARHLCYQVMKGSKFENTAVMVPMNLFIRKVWLHGEEGKGRVCVFDMEPETLKGSAEVFQNSEVLFRRALEKTVTENMAGVTGVIVLEKGIPGKPLWEVAATATPR